MKEKDEEVVPEPTPVKEKVEDLLANMFGESNQYPQSINTHSGRHNHKEC